MCVLDTAEMSLSSYSPSAIAKLRSQSPKEFENLLRQRRCRKSARLPPASVLQPIRPEQRVKKSWSRWLTELCILQKLPAGIEFERWLTEVSAVSTSGKDC